MTDNVTVNISKSSENSSGVLGLQCDAIILGVHNRLPDEYFIEIEVRFDEEKMEWKKWTRVNDQKMAATQSDRHVKYESFIEKIKKHHSLLIRYRDVWGDSHVMEFDLDGSIDAYRKLGC